MSRKIYIENNEIATLNKVYTKKEIDSRLSDKVSQEELESVLASVESGLEAKQDKLVSGTSIKTINNESVLGSGNIQIDGVTNYNELSNIPVVNQDLDDENFIPEAGVYYRHTGSSGEGTPFLPYPEYGDDATNFGDYEKIYFNKDKINILIDYISTLTYGGEGMAPIVGLKNTDLIYGLKIYDVYGIGVRAEDPEVGDIDIIYLTDDISIPGGPTLSKGWGAKVEADGAYTLDLDAGNDNWYRKVSGIDTSTWNGIVTSLTPFESAAYKTGVIYYYNGNSFTAVNGFVIDQDLDADGFKPVKNTYYRHIGKEGDEEIQVPIALENNQELKTGDKIHFDTSKIDELEAMCAAIPWQWHTKTTHPLVEYITSYDHEFITVINANDTAIASTPNEGYYILVYDKPYGGADIFNYTPIYSSVARSCNHGELTAGFQNLDANGDYTLNFNNSEMGYSVSPQTIGNIESDVTDMWNGPIINEGYNTVIIPHPYKYGVVYFYDGSQYLVVDGTSCILDQDLEADGFTPIANTYYRHTGKQGDEEVEVDTKIMTPFLSEEKLYTGDKIYFDINIDISKMFASLSAGHQYGLLGVLDGGPNYFLKLQKDNSTDYLYFSAPDSSANIPIYASRAGTYGSMTFKKGWQNLDLNGELTLTGMPSSGGYGLAIDYTSYGWNGVLVGHPTMGKKTIIVHHPYITGDIYFYDGEKYNLVDGNRDYGKLDNLPILPYDGTKVYRPFVLGDIIKDGFKIHLDRSKEEALKEALIQYFTDNPSSGGISILQTQTTTNDDLTMYLDQDSRQHLYRIRLSIRINSVYTSIYLYEYDYELESGNYINLDSDDNYTIELGSKDLSFIVSTLRDEYNLNDMGILGQMAKTVLTNYNYYYDKGYIKPLSPDGIDTFNNLALTPATVACLPNLDYQPGLVSGGDGALMVSVGSETEGYFPLLYGFKTAGSQPRECPYEVDYMLKEIRFNTSRTITRSDFDALTFTPFEYDSNYSYINLLTYTSAINPLDEQELFILKHNGPSGDSAIYCGPVKNGVNNTVIYSDETWLVDKYTLSESVNYQTLEGLWFERPTYIEFSTRQFLDNLLLSIDNTPAGEYYYGMGAILGFIIPYNPALKGVGRQTFGSLENYDIYDENGFICGSCKYDRFKNMLISYKYNPSMYEDSYILSLSNINLGIDFSEYPLVIATGADVSILTMPNLFQAKFGEPVSLLTEDRVKTINGQSLIGSGDIEIRGGDYDELEHIPFINTTKSIGFGEFVVGDVVSAGTPIHFDMSADMATFLEGLSYNTPQSGMEFLVATTHMGSASESWILLGYDMNIVTSGEVTSKVLILMDYGTQTVIPIYGTSAGSYSSSGMSFSWVTGWQNVDGNGNLKAPATDSIGYVSTVSNWNGTKISIKKTTYSPDLEVDNYYKASTTKTFVTANELLDDDGFFINKAAVQTMLPDLTYYSQKTGQGITLPSDTLHSFAQAKNAAIPTSEVDPSVQLLVAGKTGDTYKLYLAPGFNASYGCIYDSSKAGQTGYDENGWIDSLANHELGYECHNIISYIATLLKQYSYPMSNYKYIGEDNVCYYFDDSSLFKYTIDSEIDKVAFASDVATKQDTLVSGENIKTLNGESVLGSGDLNVPTYHNFDPNWTTESISTLNFVRQINNDENAVEGNVYLGDVKLSDMPGSLSNGEVTVSIIKGTVSSKVILLTLTSGNRAPYHWEYTYWKQNTTEHNSGWITWQSPLVSGTNIKTINNQSLLGSGNIQIDGPIANTTKIVESDGFTLGDTITAGTPIYFDTTDPSDMNTFISGLAYIYPMTGMEVLFMGNNVLLQAIDFNVMSSGSVTSKVLFLVDQTQSSSSPDRGMTPIYATSAGSFTDGDFSISWSNGFQNLTDGVRAMPVTDTLTYVSSASDWNGTLISYEKTSYNPALKEDNYYHLNSSRVDIAEDEVFKNLPFLIDKALVEDILPDLTYYPQKTGQGITIHSDTLHSFAQNSIYPTPTSEVDPSIQLLVAGKSNDGTNDVYKLYFLPMYLAISASDYGCIYDSSKAGTAGFDENGWSTSVRMIKGAQYVIAHPGYECHGLTDTALDCGFMFSNYTYIDEDNNICYYYSESDLFKYTLDGEQDRIVLESELESGLASKQDTLISGTNIKTINNTSILGTGDITISGGSGLYLHSITATLTDQSSASTLTGAISIISTAGTSYSDLTSADYTVITGSSLAISGGLTATAQLATDGTSAYITIFDPLGSVFTSYEITAITLDTVTTL